ncbi:MAG: type VI secretion system protein TssA [Bacteroidota bacterium]
MADAAPEPLSTPRLDAIRAPIPGDAPAGIDMKYEDAFQALKSEVDELGAATGEVDFGSIVDGATQILSETSKDLTVAGYLALGLQRTDGYAGIAEGLAAVRAVTEGFWEEAFPPLRRMRGRQAALQFVAERTSGWIQNNKATPDDRESLEHAEAEAKALQAFATEAMGEDAPAYSGVLREIREQLRRLPKPKPPAEEAPEPETKPAGGDGEAAGAPSTPPPSSSASAGADASFSTPKEATLVVMKVAQFFREADPFDAVAYGIIRAARWGAIDVPPPTGKIPAPPKPRRDALAGMLAAANHAVLAREAEASFQQSPFHFWLDLQRLASSALKGLGAPAAAAHATVVDYTASLVRRLPALPSLTFQDGTPFADPLTVAWLEEIAAPAGGASGAPAGSDESAEAIQAAREQASGGDVPGAVASLVAGAASPRDRFERTVAAAEMCLGASRPDVALALLDDVDTAVREHRLDVWDPASAAGALRLVYAAATALRSSAPADQKAALHARASDAFTRLARLDPAMAMRSTPPPK